MSIHHTTNKVEARLAAAVKTLQLACVEHTSYRAECETNEGRLQDCIDSMRNELRELRTSNGRLQAQVEYKDVRFKTMEDMLRSQITTLEARNKDALAQHEQSVAQLKVEALQAQKITEAALEHLRLENTSLKQSETRLTAEVEAARLVNENQALLMENNLAGLDATVQIVNEALSSQPLILDTIIVKSEEEDSSYRPESISIEKNWTTAISIQSLDDFLVEIKPQVSSEEQLKSKYHVRDCSVPLRRVEFKQTSKNTSSSLPRCDTKPAGKSTASETARKKCDKVRRVKAKSDLGGTLAPEIEIVHPTARPYCCAHCPAKYKHKNILKYHLLTHRGEKKTEVSANAKPKNYQCDQCPYACVIKCHMARHKMQHSGIKPYKCDECGFACIAAHQLAIHKRKHTGEKPFPCDQCSHASITLPGLTIHKMTHLAKRPFPCDQCSYSAVTRGTLVTHKMRHSGVKPFHCNECTYACTSRTDLVKHKLKHSGKKPFKCDKCPYRCAIARSLAKHSLKHLAVLPFRCDVCAYATTLSRSLAVHKMRHTGVKPFRCDQCEFACITSSNLKSHMMSHSGRPHKCDECGQMYALKTLLDAHKRRHAGDKPFRCGWCPYAAVTKFDLQRHDERMHDGQGHAGVKPFRCGSCPYAAATNYYLQRHNKRMHLDTSS